MSKPRPLKLRASLSKNFTFGVEFEFGLRFVKKPFSTPPKNWEFVKDTLMVATGFEIMTDHEINDLDRHGPEDIHPSEEYKTWTIGSDSTLYFDDEKGKDLLEYIPIEMRSPVLKFNPDSLKEIHKMLTALNTNFNVVVNRSCGLHVHVGNGTEGMSVEPLKHLMATIWIFESQISSLLPKSRSLLSCHSAPLHQCSNLGVRGFEGDLLDVPFSPSTINEVVTMFEGYAKSFRLAYLIGGLRQPFDEPVKRTIEFRQHERTTDPETFMNWVSFVVELVVWAYKVRRQDLKIILSDYLNQREGYSVEYLFKEIGFPESTVKFYRIKVGRVEEAEKEEARREKADRDAIGISSFS
ncbi:hypothetical protein SBOR_4083 [Sclerotinia borealis F-4128]|uniref:Amidoligase enzyme n=1 Tax=Sclerotinia borealis (strain F-4128) TaxID=1432307 RepID=W9CLX6_SCLBF|nr:hypothetical protein SBOR_4083 [Sclerotinia borealis F-4128]